MEIATAILVAAFIVVFGRAILWAVILVGVALGAIPSAALGRLMVVWLAKRIGVSPKEIERYGEATDGES